MHHGRQPMPPFLPHKKSPTSVGQIVRMERKNGEEKNWNRSGLTEITQFEVIHIIKLLILPSHGPHKTVIAATRATVNRPVG